MCSGMYSGLSYDVPLTSVPTMSLVLIYVLALHMFWQVFRLRHVFWDAFWHVLWHQFWYTNLTSMLVLQSFDRWRAAETAVLLDWATQKKCFTPGKNVSTSARWPSSKGLSLQAFAVSKSWYAIIASQILSSQVSRWKSNEEGWTWRYIAKKEVLFLHLASRKH